MCGSKYGIHDMHLDEVRVYKFKPEEEDYMWNVRSAMSKYARRHGMQITTKSSKTKKGNTRVLITRVA